MAVGRDSNDLVVLFVLPIGLITVFLVCYYLL